MDSSLKREFDFKGNFLYLAVLINWIPTIISYLLLKVWGLIKKIIKVIPEVTLCGMIWIIFLKYTLFHYICLLFWLTACLFSFWVQLHFQCTLHWAPGLLQQSKGNQKRCLSHLRGWLHPETSREWFGLQRVLIAHFSPLTAEVARGDYLQGQAHQLNAWDCLNGGSEVINWGALKIFLPAHPAFSWKQRRWQCSKWSGWKCTFTSWLPPFAGWGCHGREPCPCKSMSVMGASNVPWDGTCGSAQSPAGSLHLFFELSWVLLWVLDGIETTVSLHEPHFFAQTWCYALINAPELFWHVHITQKWPNNWPHFWELTFRHATGELLLSSSHCQAFICSFTAAGGNC